MCVHFQPSRRGTVLQARCTSIDRTARIRKPQKHYHWFSDSRGNGRSSGPGAFPSTRIGSFHRRIHQVWLRASMSSEVNCDLEETERTRVIFATARDACRGALKHSTRSPDLAATRRMLPPVYARWRWARQRDKSYRALPPTRVRTGLASRPGDTQITRGDESAHCANFATAFSSHAIPCPGRSGTVS